ncbi:F-box-2 domain containing protein [Pyrenophora tritici-repentis]|nr:F-box-2 domain-containing protein [Pyrenophora tritici-repentis]KAG9382183.1 F-box-2 domain containing protein [Pyrenophora tritici-repentis]KAI1524269.1 F-box-like-2 domain containing protein [Pyrenophora tritici-repentis]KAI1560078.1 F-box-like-2 domain containing protein [Pyrenophora tritici-repentis]KAI1593951.1 F-box-like-2 domain containing protein [Pyrenophora tritici-repentis]
MGVFTRAKNKREKDKTARNVKAASASTCASSPKPVVEAPLYFRILDLPAELRNRIYEHCLDDEYYNFAPSVRVRSRQAYKYRIWRFIGLTQVCKTIRSEFRPLWARNLCVRFDRRSDIDHFMKNFLHHRKGFNPVPKLVHYGWKHGLDNRQPFDITDILRLRSHSAELKVGFHPAVVADRECMWTPCASCAPNCYRPRDDDSDDDEDCTCADPGMTYQIWMVRQYDVINYTSTMEFLVNHGKEALLQDIRDKKVTIVVYFSQPCNHAAIKFSYKHAFQTDNSPPSAMDLLKRWGLLDDFEPTATMEFIVVCKNKVVEEVGGYKVTKMVDHTTMVHKLPPT